MAGSGKHPGFKGAAHSIAEKEGVSEERADKILGAANAKQQAKASHGGHVSNPRMLKHGGKK